MKRLSIAFLVVIGVVSSSLPSLVMAQTLNITLSSYQGPPETAVTIRGGGATPNTDVVVLFAYFQAPPDNCYRGRGATGTLGVRSDASGGFSVTHVVPQLRSTDWGVAYVAKVGEGLISNTVCYSFYGQTTPETLCFPNDPSITSCITEPFVQYWKSNGGLNMFGFPLAPARNEVNPATGQVYLTQWFERYRFEYHPENNPPYDILFGRLGSDGLRQMGRTWQAEGREAGPMPGCRWFVETGHNVCNNQGKTGYGFLSVWEARGTGVSDNPAEIERYNLTTYGLPLTSPQMERNSSGDLVLTQWFERARFEWHPEPGTNTGGKVLFGLLGSEMRGTDE